MGMSVESKQSESDKCNPELFVPSEKHNTLYITTGDHEQTITQKMADQGRSDIYVVFTMSLYALRL